QDHRASRGRSDRRAASLPGGNAVALMASRLGPTAVRMDVACRSAPRFTLAWFGNSRSLTGVAFVLPAVVFLGGFVAYPVYDVFRLSLFTVDFATDREKFVGLANFAQVLGGAKFATVARNTLIWTVFSLLGQFGLGLAAALCINRDMPGMRVI